MLTRKIAFLGLISVFLAGIALGGEAIPNWPAPATWSPARAHGGLTTMGDATPPLPFTGADPCRIADTRGNGFGGAYGPPSLSQGSPRNFTLTGQCGIPAGAGAVSLNVTVTNTQGPGFILIYPAGGAQPTVSTLNYVGGQTIANAAVVPLGTGGNAGAVTVIAGVSGTDLILDTNGYYASTPAASGNSFSVINSGLYAIYGQTSNTDGGAAGVYGTVTAGMANGVFGNSSSTSDLTTGVLGLAAATTGRSYGVAGQTDSTTTNTSGVFGVAAATTGATMGVRGETDSTTSGATGVFGYAFATTGVTQGIIGETFSTTTSASGVFGVAAATTGVTQGVIGETDSTTSGATGVFGLAQATTGVVLGVVGVSLSATGGRGVVGALENSAGAVIAEGLLGSSFGTAGDTTGPPWGVFAFGTLGASGAKHFVEPHPSDPTKVILYSSLEGREVGTYFRGTSRIVNHQAVIEVPEDFRIVTDEEGLTVQLTPVGELATLAVINQDLNQIVVKASRDVPFHYLVQGVRRAFKDLQPIRIGYEFVPRSPTDSLQPYLTEEARRRLIANGTYNADGSVNMETAERLGWTKMWADREAQAGGATAGGQRGVKRRE